MKTIWLFLLLFTTALCITNGQPARKVNWEQNLVKVSGTEVELNFRAAIADKWHMYSQYTKGTMPMYFQVDTTDDFIVSGKFIEITPPRKEYEEAFKATTVFWDKHAEFKQKIRLKKGKPVKLTGYIEYQICIEGACSLEDYEFEFELPAPTGSTEDNNSAVETPLNNTPPVEDSVSDKTEDTLKKLAENDSAHIADIAAQDNGDTLSGSAGNSDAGMQLRDENLWMFFLIAVASGFMAIITPCVFPMVPMTVSFFMHSADNKAKGRRQAIVFGLSIIGIYTAIGTIVSVTFGTDFTHFISTHWIPNVIFFIIFVIFAASFLGMFEIVMPNWLVSKADKQADRGGYLGAFFMAFTLVIVSFSCTLPIVGAVLILAAEGNFLKPIIGMLGFSAAFAIPFTFFAFFPSRLKNLPKSGGWLNSVKVILGFLELALGLKFLSVADQTYHWGILDREVYLAFWIVIFTLMGLYLLGKLKFPHDSDMPHLKVPRLILALITFTFVVYLVPGMFGAPLKALSGYLPPMSSHDFDLRDITREESKTQVRKAVKILGNDAALKQFDGVCEKAKYSDFLHLPHGIRGYFDLEQAIRCAQQQDKPIFVDFTGHGCVNCREMEANVWSEPQVIERLMNNFVVVALYVDDKTQMPEEDWILPDEKNGLKRPVKDIGKKNIYFQETHFQMNAQPYYLLLDYNEALPFKKRLLATPRGYNKDVEEFVRFLDNGLEEFSKRHERD
ncbi:MAG: thioredoxin family protein [Bacteroidetes bacterium]|nr:thioredoxin family protein [Bacteroidota bacterium]